MSDEYDVNALLQYLMGGGSGYLGAATPTLSPGQYNALSGIVPYGNDDLVREQARGLNYGQDILHSMADTMVGAFAGEGAYDPNAFAPLVNTSAYDSPELVAFNTYLANPTSFRGEVAQVLKAGGDPMQLVSQWQQQLGFEPLDWESEDLPAVARDLPWIQPPENNYQPTAIDWNGVRDQVQEVINQYNAIPGPGPMEQQVSDDGTIVSEGGERTWEFDDTGRLIVSENTYAPSPMAEEYQRLGLPLPTERFTPEYILGPEFEVGAAGLGDYEAAMQQAQQDYIDEMASYNQLMRGNPNAPEPVINRDAINAPRPEPAPQGGGVTETELGPIAAGAGIAENDLDRGGGYQWGEPVLQTGGAAPAVAPTMSDAYAMQSPAEFEQWYMTHRNELTDAQRWELISYASDRGLSGGSPETMNEWSQVTNRLNPDLVETAPSGSPAESIGAALNAEFEPSAGQSAVTEAYRITDPQEFVEFMNANAASMDPGQLSTIGTYASDQALSSGDPNQARIWADIGGQLQRGEFTPAAPAGAAGQSPGIANLIARRQETYGKLPQPADQVAMRRYVQGDGEPPPEDSTWIEQDQANPFAPDFQQQPLTNPFVNALPPIGQNMLPPYARPGAQQARQPGQQYQPPPLMGQGGIGVPNIASPGTNLVGPPPQPPYNPLAPQQGRARPPLVPPQGGIGVPNISVNQPPEYTQGQAQPARQPGQVEQAAMFEAMLRQILPGNQQRTTSIPPEYTQGQAQQARQPGGPGTPTPPRYTLPEIETGERPVGQQPTTAPQSEQPGRGIRTGEQPYGGLPEGSIGRAQMERAMTGAINRVRGRRNAVDRARQQRNQRFQDYLNERNRVYGADYGTALMQSYYLEQQGVTPTIAAMSARQLPIAAMGVFSPGQISR